MEHVTFVDREEAARGLAEALGHLRGTRPLVLGVPRGAVPMAVTIAAALGGEADVVLVHKLGAPGQPELAVGAVDETGRMTLAATAAELQLDERDLEPERVRVWRRLLEQRARYTPLRPPADPAGRTVIVVDDGIATGATLTAALRLVRSRHPARLVAAAAVAPPETVARLRHEADEVVVLAMPRDFLAVGAFFEDFRQVEDEEVARLLETSGARRWEHFEHGADVGIRGIGATREQAFEQAALALTAAIVDPERVRALEAVTVRCEAPDDEMLFVEWLDAIVYQMATRHMLFADYEVRIRGRTLAGTARGEPVDVARHRPAVEVKGATLTLLRVERSADGSWVAQCVVDV